MNSAPVQLLPVDNGNRHSSSQKAPEKVADGGRRFDEVFEKASVDRDRDLQKPEGNDAGEKPDIKTETGKEKTETTAVKNQKEKRRVQQEDRKDSAEATPEAAVEKAVRELKEGLSAGKNREPVKLAGIKKDGSIKKTVNDKRTLNNVSGTFFRGGEKLAVGFGAAGRSGKKTGDADKIIFFADTGKGKSTSTRDVLAGKLREAAAKTEKAGASVAFVSVVKEPSAGKTGGNENPEKKVKENKSDKLKIVDHRKMSDRMHSFHEKNTSENDLKLSRTEVEPLSKISEFGTFKEAPEFNRSGARTAEVKNFQSSLLNQLKDSINNQIVKQAGIVVKNNGTGEIKLVMKPESLGKVRIQLSLNDNHIAGRIIVENSIVREIFESNLENLYKAFGSEGFENGGLEVSVQGQNDNADGRGRRGGRGTMTRAVKVIEDAVPEVVDNEWRNNAVNMVV